MKSILVRCAFLGIGAVGCAELPRDAGREEGASAVALQLTTETDSGNRYRLGPARFTVRSVWNPEDATEVQVTGAEASLRVPVDPGDYTVSLEPGWTLNRITPAGDLVPELATLLQNDTWVYVAEFATAPVTFPFHLGETGLSIGIHVEEGVPPGYDGVIRSQSDGTNIQYSIEFATGGASCCFPTVEAARAAYPDLNLFWP